MIRPEVFISATTADLGHCRQVVKDALLNIGCVPVEQTNFPPDSRSVRDMLRARIDSCHAVIHVVGRRYGREPVQQDAGSPRRSYTQLEYEIARSAGKPVYVFVCADGFPYQKHAAEDSVLRRLQRDHIKQLISGDAVYEVVHTPEELAARVGSLTTRLEVIGQQLTTARRWLVRGVAIGLAAAVALGGGLWWLTQRTSTLQQGLAEVESEIEVQRRHMRAVVLAYGEQSIELEGMRLSSEALYERALDVAAQREGVPVSELRAAVELYRAAVASDPDADAEDRALLAFASRTFDAVAVEEPPSLAAEPLPAPEVVIEPVDPRIEAERIAAALATGRAHQQEANALRGQGRGETGEARFRLINESRVYYGQAAEAFIEAGEWTNASICRFEHGFAARDLADMSDEPVKTDFFQEAIDAFATSRELADRASNAGIRANAQFELAVTYRSRAFHEDDARSVPSSDKSLLEHDLARREAEQDNDQVRWAQVLSSQGHTRRERSYRVPQSQRAEGFKLGAADLKASAERYRDLGRMREWASAMHGHAWALGEQGRATGPDAERAMLFEQAADAMRETLVVRTKADLPDEWEVSMADLAYILLDLGNATPEPRRSKILREAIKTMRESLSLVPKGETPVHHPHRPGWIRDVEAQLTRSRNGG